MLSLKKVFFWIFAGLIVETGAGLFTRPPFLFPHLGILLVVYAAIQGGAMAGLRAGLWLGLLLDFLSLERFGTYTALYGLAGLGCGLLRGKVFIEAFVSQLLIPGSAYLAVLAGAAFLGRSDPEEPLWPIFGALVWNSAFVSTLIFSPWVFRWCASRLLKKNPDRPPGRFVA